MYVFKQSVILTDLYYKIRGGFLRRFNQNATYEFFQTNENGTYMLRSNNNGVIGYLNVNKGEFE